MNTAAVLRPRVIEETASAVGSPCVVVSIDARREDGAFRVYTHGARRPTALDAAAWAKEAVSRGAGEILLTSIDRDGTRAGYDVELTRAVADAVTVPVIASGGAGSPEHICDVLSLTAADAALIAGVVHDGQITIATIKRALAARNILVRDAA